MKKTNSFFAIATDIGGREENQDRAWALSLNQRTLLVLADGMGGHRGGAMASQVIIETAERLFRATSSPDPNTLLPQIVQESCQIIAENNRTKNLDGHSTCVLAFIDEKACLTWLRIGDSRLFIFADKHHWWRSIDHTMLDLRVLKGELTDEESRHHPDRPFVFRSVCNTVPEMKVQRFGTLPADAVLFMCSDGVWDAYPAKELFKVTQDKNLDLVTRKIVKTAVARNGVTSDNCTALLYRAPFGSAKLNLPQLHLEELHTLPQVTNEDKMREKNFLQCVIATLAIVVIVLAGYKGYKIFMATDQEPQVASMPESQQPEQDDDIVSGLISNYGKSEQPNNTETTDEDAPEEKTEEKTVVKKTKKVQKEKKLQKKAKEEKKQVEKKEDKKEDKKEEKKVENKDEKKENKKEEKKETDTKASEKKKGEEKSKVQEESTTKETEKSNDNTKKLEDKK